MLFSPNSMAMLSQGDREQAGYSGLLALAQGLMAGGAPSLQPGGLGRGMAEGFGGFAKNYQGSANNALTQKMAGLQLAEAQRKQAAQQQLSTAMGGMTAPPAQIADASGTRMGTEMASRMNQGNAASYQTALASPAAQAAIMELYGPAGIAALRKDQTPMAFGQDQGLYVPGQGVIRQPMQKLPEGYERKPDGSAAFIPGGPADPEVIKRRAGAEGEGKFPYQAPVPAPQGGSFMVPPNSPWARTTEGQNRGVITTPTSPDANQAAFNSELSKAGVKRVMETAEAAQKAADQLSSLHTARDILDKGVIAGSAAEFRLGFARALATAGITSSEDVANTDAFFSTMGRQTLDLVKNLGAGSGISNADRDYADKVAGGQIKLTPESMKKIMDINERAAGNIVDRHNTSIKSIIDDKSVPEYIKVSLRVSKPEREKRLPPPPPGARVVGGQ